MRWPSLRALVFLRRIARALDRSAAADEELVRLARSAFDNFIGGASDEAAAA